MQHVTLIRFHLAVAKCFSYLWSFRDVWFFKFECRSNASADLWRFLSRQQRVIFWQLACQLLNTTIHSHMWTLLKVYCFKRKIKAWLILIKKTWLKSQLINLLFTFLLILLTRGYLIIFMAVGKQCAKNPIWSPNKFRHIGPKRRLPNSVLVEDFLSQLHSLDFTF